MRIVTLLARHGTTQYAGAADALQALFAHQLSGVEHDLVIVDTALPETYERHVDRGRILLGSSNAHWEFSAWDRALAYLGQHTRGYDFIHLATSAFRALDVRHLDRFDVHTFRSVLGRRVGVGHIDAFVQPIAIMDHRSQAFLRTSWIFLPPHELQRLGSVVSIRNREALFSGNADAPFQPDAPLSGEYQAYILDRLTGSGSGQGGKWHSQFFLRDETLAYFEAKTMAMLNEVMLSIRLVMQGCSMIDVTWLATRRAQCRGLPLGLIPSWQWQTQARQLVLDHEGLSSRSPVTSRRTLRRRRSSHLAGMHIDRAPRSVRSSLVVGECWDLAKNHGAVESRKLVYRAVLRDPWLLTSRPVLGALRRLTLASRATLSSPENAPARELCLEIRH